MAVTTLAGLNCAYGQTKGKKAGNRDMRDRYELRVYHLKSAADRGLLDAYLSKALIPALNRLNSKPVGAFVQQDRSEKPSGTEVRDDKAVLVLIPFASVGSYTTAMARLNADEEFKTAGAEYLQAPKNQPAFERSDSWLMLAFAGIPKIELPAYCQEKNARMFELRTYESYSEVKAQKKVDMFNNGEIQLMRDVGLGPIFFGQALIGTNLPHLTYMLSAENPEAHTKHWDAFKVHPTWDKLKNDPQYADTVSRIANRFLVPTAYSQI